MNIVYISARFLPYYGGAEQHCYQVAKRVAAAGNQVYVITTNKDATGKLLPSTQVIDGINVIRLNNIMGDQLLAGIYPNLYGEIKKIDPKVIHVMNGPGFIFRDIVLTIYKLFHPKIVLLTTPHGEFMPTPHTHTGIKYLLARLIKFTAKPYLVLWWSKLWNVVFTANNNQQNWLKTYGVSSKKIKFMPSCIEESYIETVMPTKPLEPIVITYVGRISKYKGVQNLIAAVSKLKNTNYKLKILGKMEYPAVLDQVKQLGMESKIEFIINPKNQERDEILRNESLIHVLPSSYEATGIVLLEAMAKGNTVITTSQNEGATTFINNGVNGYIYDYDDVQKLTQILDNLLSNPKLINKQAESNLQIIKNFTWEHTVPKYITVLNELVQKV